MKADRSIPIDGAKLSAARIAANMSLEEVGIVLKRNRGTISKWERGLDCPSMATLQQLALLYKEDNFIPTPPKGIGEGQEQWKPVTEPELKDRYIVSNYGRVARLLSETMSMPSGAGAISLRGNDSKPKMYRFKDLVSKVFLSQSTEW